MAWVLQFTDKGHRTSYQVTQLLRTSSTTTKYLKHMSFLSCRTQAERRHHIGEGFLVTLKTFWDLVRYQGMLLHSKIHRSTFSLTEVGLGFPVSVLLT